MSTPPPLDPIYCRKCKAQVLPDKQFCPSCGWDQRVIYDAQTEAAKEAQAKKSEEAAQKEAYRARKRQEEQEDMKPPAADAPGAFSEGGTLNPANPYTAEEYTRQYTVLYWYIAFAVLGILTGPIAIGLFIYAIVQQGALRRRAAEMGINPDELTRAARARFWNASRPLQGVAIAIVATIGLGILVVAGSGSCASSLSAIGRGRDSRFIGRWGYESGDTEREFFGNGQGKTFIYLNGQKVEGAIFEWSTKNNRLYCRYKSTLKPNAEWSEESSEDFHFLGDNNSVKLSSSDLGEYSLIRMRY